MMVLKCFYLKEIVFIWFNYIYITSLNQFDLISYRCSFVFEEHVLCTDGD